jgi:type IV pilus assembly protein PilX
MNPIPNSPSGSEQPRTEPSRRRKQRGLVLIVSIVLLAIVSVLAAFSTRNAASAENVSGNVRLTELAMQAAEIALRHCEESVAEVIAVDAGATPSYPTLGFTTVNILPEGSESIWQTASEWDTPTAPVYVLPLEQMNQPDLVATYNRPPECMVGRLPFVLPSGAISTTAAFVITARGFGPEVPAANSNRSRPVGSEAWLQSHIELQ